MRWQYLAHTQLQKQMQTYWNAVIISGLLGSLWQAITRKRLIFEILIRKPFEINTETLGIRE